MRCLVDHHQELLDPDLEERVDQRLSVGEAAIDGADADPGPRGDLVEAHLEAPLGEQLGGGLKDAPPVALGVGPQGSLVLVAVVAMCDILPNRRDSLRLCATVSEVETFPPLRKAPMTDTKPLDPHHSRRWLILGVIALAQLMVVLDVTIVNIALPSAQADLGFSDDSRQWVITAYALAFGSLLLLGGKISDLIGRKWTFVAGLLGFAGASAVGGAAPSFEVLIAARALQGAFAAMLAPPPSRSLDHDLHRSRRARQGVRRLRRDRRLRRGGRPAPGRRADRAPRLALDMYVNLAFASPPPSPAPDCSSICGRPSARGSTCLARSPPPPACSRWSTASPTPRWTDGARRSRSRCWPGAWR